MTVLVLMKKGKEKNSVKEIVDSNNGIAGYPDLLTDGIWLWPGVLENCHV